MPISLVDHSVLFHFPEVHQCAPRGPAALAVGGIGAGDQRGIAAFVGVVS